MFPSLAASSAQQLHTLPASALAAAAAQQAVEDARKEELRRVAATDALVAASLPPPGGGAAGALYPTSLAGRSARQLHTLSASALAAAAAQQAVEDAREKELRRLASVDALVAASLPPPGGGAAGAFYSHSPSTSTTSPSGSMGPEAKRRRFRYETVSSIPSSIFQIILRKMDPNVMHSLAQTSRDMSDRILQTRWEQAVIGLGEAKTILRTRIHAILDEDNDRLHQLLNSLKEIRLIDQPTGNTTSLIHMRDALSRIRLSEEEARDSIAASLVEHCDRLFVATIDFEGLPFYSEIRTVISKFYGLPSIDPWEIRQRIPNQEKWVLTQVEFRKNQLINSNSVGDLRRQKNLIHELVTLGRSGKAYELLAKTKAPLKFCVVKFYEAYFLLKDSQKTLSPLINFAKNKDELFSFFAKHLTLLTTSFPTREDWMRALPERLDGLIESEDIQADLKSGVEVRSLVFDHFIEALFKVNPLIAYFLACNSTSIISSRICEKLLSRDFEEAKIERFFNLKGCSFSFKLHLLRLLASNLERYHPLLLKLIRKELTTYTNSTIKSRVFEKLLFVRAGLPILYRFSFSKASADLNGKLDQLLLRVHPTLGTELTLRDTDPEKFLSVLFNTMVEENAQSAKKHDVDKQTIDTYFQLINEFYTSDDKWSQLYKNAVSTVYGRWLQLHRQGIDLATLTIGYMVAMRKCF